MIAGSTTHAFVEQILCRGDGVVSAACLSLHHRSRLLQFVVAPRERGRRLSIGCALVCLTSSVLRNYCSFSGLCYLLWIWQARRAFFLSCLQVLIVLVVIYLLICLFDLFSPQGFRLFSWRDSVRSHRVVPLCKCRGLVCRRRLSQLPSQGSQLFPRSFTEREARVISVNTGPVQ